jgi:hypothetical protein
LWYPAVVTHLPTAPEPLIDEALRWAADEFCTRSGIAQEYVSGNATANDASVPFTPPTDTEIRRFVRVWYGENELVSAGPTLVDDPKAYGTPDSGTPRRYLDARGNTLRVYPAPSTGGTGAFTALVAVAPTPAATTLPDVLYREWREAIAAGARSYIKSIPNQPFSGDSARDTAFFYTKLTEAAGLALLGTVRGQVQVRSPVSVCFFKR